MNPTILYKKEGETPLECIDRAREEGRIPKNEKATYAGRLDPMAEGLLIVLTGDAVHKKEEYIKLPKEYVVEVLFGVSTDTGDVLGKIEKQNTDTFFLSSNFSSPRFSSQLTSNSKSVARPDIEKLEDETGFEIQNTKYNIPARLNDSSYSGLQDTLEKCAGTFFEEYPKYSSRTVSGKPLFSLARLGQIFHIPKHKVVIHSVILQKTKIEKGGDIAKNSIERIRKVKGDFRQEEITKLWQDFGEKNKDVDFSIIEIKVSCESGAYMRVLAEKIGNLLGVPSLAYSIKRTKIGEFGG